MRKGVIFHPLVNPARVLSEDGRVTGIDLVAMRQTEIDAKGRRGVEPIPGSERFMPCTTLIAAIGQQVQSGAIRAEDGLSLTRWGWVEIDPFDLATSRPGVFAGGDCAFGPSTLIHAMANGLQAARSINDWIQLGHTCFFPRTRMRALLHTHKLLASRLRGGAGASANTGCITRSWTRRSGAPCSRRSRRPSATTRPIARRGAVCAAIASIR